MNTNQIKESLSIAASGLQYDPMDQAVLNKVRTDKFMMTLSLPKAMREINVSQSRNNDSVMHHSMQFSVAGVVVPAVVVDPVEVPFSGQSFNFTSFKRPDYSNVSVSFKIDNEYNNYWVIYKWINLLNNYKEGFFYAERPGLKHGPGNEPYSEYATDITIFGLDEYNEKKIQFTYIGAVPVSLGEISYSYQDSSEISSSFEFAFSQLHTKLL